jgi:hypothetical protein
MRKPNHLPIALLLLAVAFMPYGASHALLLSDGRYQKQEELHKALDTAASHYRSNQNLSSLSRRSERELEESEVKLPMLAREKREVRLQLSAVLSTLHTLKEEHGIDPTDTEHMQKLLAEGEEQLRFFIRFLHVRGVSDSSENANGLLRQYLISSLGERTEQGMRDKAMLRARARLLGMITTAQQFQDLESELRQEHEELMGQYIALLEQSEVAKRHMHASAGGQVEINRIVAEVHEQILKMQSELARIDARIRRRSERTLIREGHHYHKRRFL